MKKLMFPLALILLCLFACCAAAESGCEHIWDCVPRDNEYHHLVCSVCGEVSDWGVNRHAVSCSRPIRDVCSSCGAKAEDGAVVLVVHDWQVQRDEFSTWNACRTCGEIDPDSKHYHDWKPVITQYDHRMECECGDIHEWANHETTCDHADACQVCGAKVSDGAVITFLTHVGVETPNRNRLYHWTECSVCGEKFRGNEYHTAVCLTPDVCDGCGATVSGDGIQMETVYHSTFHMEFDAVSHWNVCDRCGRINAKGTHTAPCYMDYICAECHANVENDGIVIGEVTHPSYTVAAKETTHQYVCQICEEVFNEEAHFALCTAPGECAVCCVSYEGPPRHEKMMNDCVPVDETYHEYVCFYCEQKVKELHQFRDDECEYCFYSREPLPTAAPTAEPTAAPTAPPASDWRYGQTVCCLGIRFRDIAPQLTKKWYMFTPLDLSAEGTTAIPLLCGNAAVIGEMTVAVKDGKMTAAYRINPGVAITDMLFSLLPDIDGLEDIDIQQMKTYPFDAEISIGGELNGDTRVLLYVIGHADYDRMDGRNEAFSDAAPKYKAFVEELKSLMAE